MIQAPAPPSMGDDSLKKTASLTAVRFPHATQGKLLLFTVYKHYREGPLTLPLPPPPKGMLMGPEVSAGDHSLPHSRESMDPTKRKKQCTTTSPYQ